MSLSTSNVRSKRLQNKTLWCTNYCGNFCFVYSAGYVWWSPILLHKECFQAFWMEEVWKNCWSGSLEQGDLCQCIEKGFFKWLKHMRLYTKYGQLHPLIIRAHFSPESTFQTLLWKGYLYNAMVSSRPEQYHFFCPNTKTLYFQRGLSNTQYQYQFFDESLTIPNTNTNIHEQS